MIRTAKNVSTMLMIAVMWMSAATALYWTADYFRPPIEVIDSNVALDLPHDRIEIGTTFVWERHCEGALLGWIRSTAPEPPPRNWMALDPVKLPPKGFSGDVRHAGDVVTRWVSVPLNGYVPRGDGIVMVEREFACNPLQRLFPLTVRAPFARFSAGVPD